MAELGNNFYEEEEEEPDPDARITLGYMIARPKEPTSNTPARICIIYTRWNDTYSWTVDTNGCVRNIRPGSSGVTQFNSTRIGELKHPLSINVEETHFWSFFESV